MPDKESGVEKLGRGLRSLASDIKTYTPVAKGVAKTFLLPRSKNEEENVDFSPGPTPKIKTSEPPKDWYKESSEHKIPSYEQGTDYVPESGPAILHKGEKVVSKDKNMASDKVSKVASALGSAGRATGVQAPEDQAQDLAVKQANIDEYQSSMQTPASEPKPAAKSPKDRVGSKPYGSRPGEQRIDVSGMTKKLPSYEDGVESVPEDGPAMLHEGEKVVPEVQNPDSEAKPETRMKGAMGGKKKLAAKKGSKKKSHKITVHKSANGGVVLEHHFDGGKSEMHHHPDFNSAAESMAPHFDVPGSSEGGPGTQMASPSSFEDGGVVEKSGQAQVHEGEVVVPKDQANKVIQNPAITIGGKQKPKSFAPFAGDPKKDRPTKKQTREEINAIRKSGVGEGGRWRNDPKVATRDPGKV